VQRVAVKHHIPTLFLTPLIKSLRLPSKPTLASPGVAQPLARPSSALGLTLRGVQEISGTTGNPIPHSTLARIEAVISIRAVRRLRQLLDLYQTSDSAAGSVLDVEALCRGDAD